MEKCVGSKAGAAISGCRFFPAGFMRRAWEIERVFCCFQI